MAQISPARPSLRHRLLAGESCAGPFLKLPTPEVTELVALAGLDLVVVDLEHSQFTAQTAVGAVRAAQARGIDAVVRTAERSASQIAAALDLGASGVIVPGVASIDDARQVVRAARFHPVGERGMDLYARAAGWGATPRQRFLEAAAADVLVGVMVEGAAVVGQLDALAQVEGLDLLFVGPYDLSQSLGYPGEVDRPEVAAAIEQAAATAARHGRVLGLYVDDVATATRYRRLGVRFIGMSNDADLLRRALAQVRAELASA